MHFGLTISVVKTKYVEVTTAIRVFSQHFYGDKYTVLFLLQRTPLDELVYVADNLAFFPYALQDEPLYIIHQIDILVSVSGSNLIQSFQEVSFLPIHHPFPPYLGVRGRRAIVPIVFSDLFFS